MIKTINCFFLAQWVDSVVNGALMIWCKVSSDHQVGVSWSSSIKLVVVALDTFFVEQL